MPLFFVTHPRTLQRLQQVKRAEKLVEVTDQVKSVRPEFIYLLPPLPYLDFLRLMSKSTAVLTDSGGIQEETTFLDIPCLTLRKNTERPSTVELGTNRIVGLDAEKIAACLDEITHGRWKKCLKPPLWDGAAAQRVVQALRGAWAGSLIVPPGRTANRQNTIANRDADENSLCWSQGTPGDIQRHRNSCP